MSAEEIRKVAEIILDANFLIALTGAGISAESGIPTFRGKNGLWNKYRPEELATPQAFKRDPIKVWEWYRWRIGLVLKAKPNPGHIALAELEKLGFLKALITQNVDDLHERAGSRRVIKLHGNILEARCINCEYKTKFSEPPREIPPKCPVCSSLLRPNVVWFNEPLPEEALREALSLTYRADAILVVGTSGVVMPAGAIPFTVKERGGVVIEINISESAITPIVDIFLRGPAGKLLPAIIKELRKKY
ncbi:MAG: NAD-dependent protein deacetylase [Candidatus Njordarchaeales archaeon]